VGHSTGYYPIHLKGVALFCGDDLLKSLKTSQNNKTWATQTIAKLVNITPITMVYDICDYTLNYGL